VLGDDGHGHLTATYRTQSIGSVLQDTHALFSIDLRIAHATRRACVALNGPRPRGAGLCERLAASFSAVNASRLLGIDMQQWAPVYQAVQAMFLWLEAACARLETAGPPAHAGLANAGVRRDGSQADARIILYVRT
jgi:hypothetical protein